MAKNVFLPVFAALILLSACLSNKDSSKRDLRVIDVAGSVGGGRVVNLSEIASEIQYIPLETNDESILGLSFKRVQYENGILYYIQKHDLIKIFDKEGRFLKVFNRKGRGPQEYEYFGRLIIDNINNRICITLHNKIIEYNLDGQFVRSLYQSEKDDTEGCRFSYSLKLSDNLYVLTNELTTTISSGYSFVAIDSSSKVILRIKYPDEEKEFVVKKLARQYAFADPYIFKFKDRVRIINGNSEFILGLNKDLQIDTSYILNYGKYNIRNTSLGMRPDNNIPYVSRFSSVYESDNYLLMQFHMGSLAHKPREMQRGESSGEKGSTYKVPISCSMFNKKTGEFTFVDQPAFNQVGFIEDFEGGPAFWPLYTSEDGYMVSTITAMEFISFAETLKVSEKFKKIAANLKDSDNPVLVLVKLK